jgi:LysM repeat protein
MKTFKTILEEIKIPNENTWYKKKRVSTPEDKPEVAPSPAPEAAPVEKPQSKSIVMKGNTVQGTNRVTPMTPNVQVPQTPTGSGPARKQQTQQMPSPIHSVKQGETARDLARKHGMSEREFLDLNKGIKDPNKIPQGTKVRTRK